MKTELGVISKESITKLFDEYPALKVRCLRNKAPSSLWYT